MLGISIFDPINKNNNDNLACIVEPDNNVTKMNPIIKHLKSKVFIFLSEVKYVVKNIGIHQDSIHKNVESVFKSSAYLDAKTLTFSLEMNKI